MRKRLLLFILTVAAFESFAQNTGILVMTGYSLLTGNTASVAIFDEICKRDIGEFTVAGPAGKTLVGPLCINNFGYIGIRTKRMPSGKWITHDRKRPGDNIEAY